MISSTDVFSEPLSTSIAAICAFDRDINNTSTIKSKIRFIYKCKYKYNVMQK